MPSPRPGRAPPPAAEASPDAPHPPPFLLDRLPAWATRRRLALAAVGVAAYLLALLAATPAALAVDRSERVAAVGGTVWRGEALLAGGSLLAWRWAPLRTLARAAFAADFTVAGAGTELGGRALLRPRSVRLDDVAGTADGGLLEALAPGLPFRCDLPLTADLRAVEVGGGSQLLSGRMTGGPGACRPKGGGAATPLPALALDAARTGRASGGTIAPAAQRRRALVRFRLAQDGAFSLAVTRDGAATLPFAAPPAGLVVETRL